MKIVLRIAVVVLILLAVIVLVVLLRLNTVVKTAVETIGPKVAGVPVTLNQARISPVKGELMLRGLLVGNPEGFSTPNAMSLGHFEAWLDMKSLFKDPLVINRILIRNPEITYEQTLKGNNLSALMEQIKRKEQPSEEKKKAEGKKVVIDDLQVEGAMLNVSMSGLGGKSASIPLPAIHLTDIGKESEGTSMGEAALQVVGAILKSATGAVAASVDILGEGASKVGEAARQGAETAGEAAKKGVETVGEGTSKAFGKFKELLPGGATNR
ncbi:MAG TPA: hypothetical protein DCZ95_09100 [Verrucomicrobia bacterium]|nr:MAG: hypothetical protein A2X46_03285 [Lentisphaerae bacterium GWF2_57_35]HBA84234.1 hypothetical protein [Verrucomicrobiota bacterium]